MTITYPRFFPVNNRFAGGDFTLRRNLATNQLYSGQVQSMELADPVWDAQYEVVIKSWKERALWKAWLDTLRGGMQKFWAHHPIQHYPLAYGVGVLSMQRAGGGAFNGEASIVSADTYSILLTDLPAAYIASPGDFVSIVRIGGNRALHRVVEEAVADSYGNIELTVEPYVRPGWASGSTAVQLVRSSVLMSLRPDSISAPDSPNSNISFSAVQSLE